jgi:hypothetical protein
MLTSSEKKECWEGPVLGLEALEERCQSQYIEDQMQESEVHQGKRVQPVHCEKGAD